MKIESIIRREGGSKVRLGSREYRFQPDDKGRHVAEVKDKAHVERLLSIKEGYRALDGKQPDKVPATSVKPDDAKPVEPKDEGGEKKDEPKDEKPVDTSDREALARKFEEVFGRQPHGKWTAERIAQELEQA